MFPKATGTSGGEGPPPAGSTSTGGAIPTAEPVSNEDLLQDMRALHIKNAGVSQQHIATSDGRPEGIEEDINGLKQDMLQLPVCLPRTIDVVDRLDSSIAGC